MEGLQGGRGHARDTVTQRGQVLSILPLDLRAGLLVLYGVMFDCTLLAACAAAVISSARFPIAGATLTDVVAEAKARWRYAGRWESDVLAGIAAYLDFRQQRLAGCDLQFVCAVVWWGGYL